MIFFYIQVYKQPLKTIMLNPSIVCTPANRLPCNFRYDGGENSNPEKLPTNLICATGETPHIRGFISSNYNKGIGKTHIPHEKHRIEATFQPINEVLN